MPTTPASSNDIITVVDQGGPVTVTIQSVGGQPKAILSPSAIRVKKGQTVQVTVEGADQFDNYLGVEVHVPGNEERNLMHRNNGNGRADVVYQRKHPGGNGTSFRVGQKAMAGPHEYRIYVHFSGSVDSKEATTPTNGRPTMIVE
jgi:hypothetical protein